MEAGRQVTAMKERLSFGGDDFAGAQGDAGKLLGRQAAEQRNPGQQGGDRRIRAGRHEGARWLEDGRHVVIAARFGQVQSRSGDNRYRQRAGLKPAPTKPCFVAMPVMFFTLTFMMRIATPRVMKKPAGFVGAGFKPAQGVSGNESGQFSAAGRFSNPPNGEKIDRIRIRSEVLWAGLSLPTGLPAVTGIPFARTRCAVPDLLRARSG